MNALARAARRTHPAPVKGIGIASETAEVHDTSLSHLIPQITIFEITRKGGENMKGINDLVWNFEPETTDAPPISMNACCGESTPAYPSPRPPRGGPAKPPMFTEK